MANTYELISSVTVGAGGASSIDFTSIPSTYTDLVLKVSSRCSVAASVDTLALKFNGSTSGYSDRGLQGNGSSASSSSASGSKIYIGNSSAGNNTANTFGNMEVYIPNYAGSTNKSVSADSVSEDNATAAYQRMVAGLWSNTAAINQVTLNFDSGNFVQYSTAYLYGIKNSQENQWQIQK